MARFDEWLERGTSIAKLLKRAGMRADFVLPNRSFASGWAWDDGSNATVTVWRDELRNLESIPEIAVVDPRTRSDLFKQRRKHAQERFDILKKYAGRQLRVIVQTKASKPAQPGASKSKQRCLDPEVWTPIFIGTYVVLRRLPTTEFRHISIDGNPMAVRTPQFTLRETRPDQIRFRDLVSAKSGGRCSLTGAPSEVCEAAHYPWSDWRKDNEAGHGILLRRDIHAALDSGLLEINRKGCVVVSEYLAGFSDEYRKLHGRVVEI